MTKEIVELPHPDTEAGLDNMAAAGAAGQLRVAAGQLPDDALLQLGRGVPVQERLQRTAAAAVASHVDQLSWRQVSDALREIRACFLATKKKGFEIPIRSCPLPIADYSSRQRCSDAELVQEWQMTQSTTCVRAFSHAATHDVHPGI